MKRKFVTVLLTIIIIFLILVVVYETNVSDSGKETIIAENEEAVPVEEIVEPETGQEDMEAVEEVVNHDRESASSVTNKPGGSGASSSQREVIVPETFETEEEEAEENPTLRLRIYEGPVVIPDQNMCYYRVEAIASGDPYPAIQFSKDDSHGAWGRNRTQVNLSAGESYNLVVTAANSEGTVTRSINLSWPQ